MLLIIVNKNLIIVNIVLFLAYNLINALGEHQEARPRWQDQFSYSSLVESTATLYTLKLYFDLFAFN